MRRIRLVVGVALVAVVMTVLTAAPAWAQNDIYIPDVKNITAEKIALSRFTPVHHDEITQPYELPIIKSNTR